MADSSKKLNRAQRRNERRLKRAERRKKVKGVANTVNNGLNSATLILSFIICIALIFTMYKQLTGQTDVISFRRILDIFQSAGDWQIDPSFILRLQTALTSEADWGIFNFLREIWNVIAQIFSFAVFLVTGFVNLLTFALKFLGSFLGI